MIEIILRGALSVLLAIFIYQAARDEGLIDFVFTLGVFGWIFSLLIESIIKRIRS